MIARDTIFALSSGALPSGVAVVRLSGPATAGVLERMTGSVPPPRRAKLTAIANGEDVLDRGLCLFFPGPTSFTGEDCGELHLHGGRAVVAAVLDTLGSLPGMRAAEAGEFTKRAFLHGKVDLTGAEALSDLIAAETEAQRRFALANSSEQHRMLYEGWRQQLIHARAMIEAELDFADESDVPGSVAETVWAEVTDLRAAISAHAATYRDAEILRDGYQVVILGAPNAGKSSLLNALARRDVAIVTDEPGTTRDILEVNLDIGGMKVVLTDTAGIREARGRVEAIGIERSLERAERADLVLLLEDAAAPVPFRGLPDRPFLRVGNKSDLLVGQSPDYDCLISTASGDGLERLLDLLRERSAGYRERAGEILPFRARHVALLNEAVESLDAALHGVPEDLELRAENLRVASAALGRVCGDIDVEDLLDTIFSSFCIGK
ncbi:tRNA uridine-5-carboxymethylaminomethyl(34) synthesis GTPase MnmE [Chelativorans sp. M5D2P16]|uniref:tRNA uridine-5-carboxymethylaminomethyl(34) synthesis GTPase MnmE n=1 Tax=Chelativorans sp. M5D2P16 TaxID=3095678 RepID=UPI002ACAB6B5|nr:tRNA uridine-5-carboxymethylaminomethyl(34) synthesis GTPase MnmE [Chelativorans sp. M5D2P16]MDZ5697415.1 tRNA uridine-5-carboxymethylaminomethyl(34) synthesis GTPase MnmE [Chelativorans sp. M5D2P16]